MTYLIFAGGLALLIFCGDALVRGAVALATRLSIPTMVTGLTIVAFGTSAPELVVSLKAALTGSSGIAIGNVVGSNIANILLVLGIPALIYATNCAQPMIRRNMIYVILASVLFILFCFTGPLNFWHGLILFSLMVAFLIESGLRAMKSEELAASISGEASEIAEGPDAITNKPWQIAGFLAIGLIGLPVAAHLTVDSATHIARNFGVSEAVIGITLVAIGTSLPELITTVMAAVRRHCGLVLGNVLGSNLFNILGIMGITAMVTPIAIPREFLEIDLWIMLGATLAITPIVFRHSQITPVIGSVFVLCYAIYIFTSFTPKTEKSPIGATSATVDGVPTFKSGSKPSILDGSPALDAK